ncbi:MAG: transposase, partial [Candidatus Omnitrophica bacterium]|nr:transposase [Candidatus Omnitrophota bacterium]
YQTYYTQASKLLKRLKALNSIFIYPYINKKERIIAEHKQIKQKIKALKKKYKLQLLARRYLRIYVLSNSTRKAEQRLKKIKKLKTKFKQQRKLFNHINLLIKYKDNVFCHLNYNYMPYTNNTLENLIKQYEKRLKTIEGFGNNQSIIKGYLNLMAICYCFKSYTDCKKNNKYKNGKSPLEIAGVFTKSLDWVRYSLKTSNS